MMLGDDDGGVGVVLVVIGAGRVEMRLLILPTALYVINSPVVASRVAKPVLSYPRYVSNFNAFTTRGTTLIVASVDDGCGWFDDEVVVRPIMPHIVMNR